MIILQVLRVTGLLIGLSMMVQGFEFKDLYGTWKGKRSETRNGVGTYMQVVVTASKGLDGGLVFAEKGNSPSYGPVTFRHTFRKDGRYMATYRTSYGFIIATITGKWKTVPGGVSVSGTGRNLSGTSKFSGTLKLLSANRLVYSGMSGSVRVVISASRS